MEITAKLRANICERFRVFHDLQDYEPIFGICLWYQKSCKNILNISYDFYFYDFSAKDETQKLRVYDDLIFFLFSNLCFVISRSTNLIKVCNLMNYSQKILIVDFISLKIFLKVLFENAPQCVQSSGDKMKLWHLKMERCSKNVTKQSFLIRTLFARFKKKILSRKSHRNKNSRKRKCHR